MTPDQFWWMGLARAHHMSALAAWGSVHVRQFERVELTDYLSGESQTRGVVSEGKPTEGDVYDVTCTSVFFE